MNHLTDLIAALATHNLNQAVLATVVQVEGSAYRQPGARMLILADGQNIGMVSGGCLEKHLVQRAFWLTRDGACVQTYHTAETDNASELDNVGNSKNFNLSENPIKRDITQRLTDEQMGFGLGCNGTIKVLFERVMSDFCQNLMHCLQQIQQRKQSKTLATVIATDYPNGSSHGYLNGCPKLPIGWHGSTQQFEQILFENPQQPWQKTQKPASRKSPFIIESYQMLWENNKYHCEILIETLQPPLHLLIFGAGQDSVPLVTMAKLQGWQVSLIDSRADYIRHANAHYSRLPTPRPDQLICLPLSQAGNIAAALTAYPTTAVAIMTHSMTQDTIWLSQALLSLSISSLISCQNSPFYIGQLGPRYRTENLLANLSQTLPELQNLLSSDRLEKTLFYPMGLDLGGDTPEAVALSIIAQIQAVHHQANLPNPSH